MRIAVIGAGVFGLAAAIELAARGHDVSVFEQGAAPHPGASSTDVSKGVRRTWYGGDNHTYVELVERSSRQWTAWEERWGERFYHRTGGVSVTSRSEPGGAMQASVRFLRERGADVRVLSAQETGALFPQLRLADDEVCVYDRWAGYVESGRAVGLMAAAVRDAGGQVRENTPVIEVDEQPSGVEVAHADGRETFDCAVVAAGPWVGRLLPEIGAGVRVTHQQMILIEPRRPEMFAHGAFPVWHFDPGGDGWYGFPLLREGWVKAARDRLGPVVDPDISRAGTPDFAEEALAFLRQRIPDMAAGRIVEGRSCLYTATPDDHFVVDRAPGRERVFAAGGGSGHGFKFGGSIGPVIADAVEGRPNPLGERFRIGSRLAGDRLQGHSRGFARPTTDSA